MQLTPVSKEHHAGKSWRSATKFSFAAKDILFPVIPQDLPSATLTFPITFILHGETFIPAMLTGVIPEKNLFVASDGRWLADMVPTNFHTQPFALALNSEGQHILCVDENSGLVADDASGLPFFTDNNLSEPTSAIVKVLQEVEAGKKGIQAMAARLHEMGLIVPWTAGVSQIDPTLGKALHQIDEQAFNALGTEQFLQLRETGALLLVYCQLLSMRHLPKLISLNARLQAPVSKVATTNTPVDFTPADSEIFNFDFLRSDE